MQSKTTLAALALAACAGESPSTSTAKATEPAAIPAKPGRETVTVDVGGRQMEVLVSRPALIRGAAIFGHGLGGAPGNYPKLIAALNERGWLVVAPTHFDSLARRDPVRLDDRILFTAFQARVDEQGAAARLAKREAPGLPLVAVGHSFGALFAAMKGGALAGLAPTARDPDVRASLMFSSPGRIPGVAVPQNFASMQVPLMTVTGTRDVVGGFIPDARAHLTAFEGAPAGRKLALIVQGGGHNLIERDAGPGRDRALEAALDFLDAHGRGDRAAAARLAALESNRAFEVRR